MESLLELKSVGYSYHTMDGETAALTDINFTIYQGEFLAIVGPSGCGKSTLLSLISGLLPPERGTIAFGASVQTPSPLPSENALGAHSPLTIGYMLQHDHLLEWRTIEKNVLLGLEIQKKLTADRRQAVMDMLHTYGLAAFKDARPSQLSGGMRQRAALIRTLALNPQLLLLDEPFSALDYQTRLTVGDDIGTIIKKEGKTAVLVTHDLSEAVSLGDRVIVLTSRPAHIQTIVNIDFPPALTPLQRRSHENFKDYFNTIWKEMNQPCKTVPMS